MKKFFNNKATVIVSGFIIALVLVLTSYVISSRFDSNKVAAGNATTDNSVMLQGFEWFLVDNGLIEEKGYDIQTLWEFYEENAQKIADAGITSIWLPPAFKTDNMTAGNTQGYEPYDLYDLGEFNQKGRVSTKYGTKDQYLAAIDALHESGIQVYADIIIGHKTGADYADTNVTVNHMDWGNRTNCIGTDTIDAWANFEFAGRNNKYSSFKWNRNHFDANTYNGNLYMYPGKSWDTTLSSENGCADYLMFLDYDLDNAEVTNELKTWGEWYVNFCNLDGFRIDAVKHMSYNFVTDFMKTVSNNTGKDLFAVGEYYDFDVSELTDYIAKTQGVTELFDMPLRRNFTEASVSGSTYDLTKLYNDTLVNALSDYAVTFVDNHDEQAGRLAMNSTEEKNEYVRDGFKQQAYAAILTRQEGYPCVFYGDYYGTTEGTPKIQDELNKLLYVRKTFAYGTQNDYFFDSNCIGWSRCGDDEHEGSGLAALISDYAAKSTYSKEMYVGTSHKGEIWIDYTGNMTGYVIIDDEGYGAFSCNGGSYSVWAKADEATAQEIQDAIDGNIITVYYYSKWGDSTYFHYRIDKGAWTTSPGKKMSATSISGLYMFKTSLGTGTKLEFCFNNGSGTWNNNNNNNFKIYAGGDYTISGTTITDGAPEGVTTVVATAAPEAETVNNVARVYYYTGWTNPYIHYRPNGSTWTVAPGCAMNVTTVDKYFYYDIDLGSATTATVCFNNGSGSWDSHNNANYTVVAGDNFVMSGNTTYAAPSGVEIPEPEEENLEDVDLTLTEEEEIVVVTSEEDEIVDNKVKVYYYNSPNWTNVYIHYKVSGGSWTVANGVAMEYYGDNLWVYEIDLGAAEAAMVCFNNGSGAWDSMGGANYAVGTGTYLVKNTVVSEMNE
ncbi:MAG: alpha-amylase [Lachnospiraceae bacterium]|nr:alpha-amylase [Lachnospiraceae bacterium]